MLSVLLYPLIGFALLRRSATASQAAVVAVAPGPEAT